MAHNTKTCPICHLEVWDRFFAQHVDSPHDRKCYVPGCNVWCTRTSGSGSVGLNKHVRLAHPGQVRIRGTYNRKGSGKRIPESIENAWKAFRWAHKLGKTDTAAAFAYQFHELMCMRHGVKQVVEEE